MLERTLEPEVMDTAEEARDYDAMDHGEVNRLFVDDLLAVCPAPSRCLDLGTGTARIPIELCGRLGECRVLAADLAAHMLDLARYNVEAEGLGERIQLERIDAKQLPFEDGQFDAVISNSIVHHIPEPASVIGEALRVVEAGGRLFFRDLLRPASIEEVDRLVELYAGEESEHARKMFRDSLRAALTVEEVRELVSAAGGDPDSVRATSDRHWTWSQEA